MPRLRAVDVGEAVDDVVDMLAAQASHREAVVQVRRHAPDGVVADRDLLDRVLMNLVTNALKFSPVGATITVELGADLRPPSGLAGTVVAVRDQGPGISAADREHLFERFTSLALPGGQRTVGSGLGLAFCHKVLALMGGEIWVESGADGGSVFAFVLPTADNSLLAHARRDGAGSTVAGGQVDASDPTDTPAISAFRNDRSRPTR
jgi:signal transduction histidine kinase